VIEFRRVVWSWEGALARLEHGAPDLAAPLLRSVRPLAADRLPDGGLDLVLGCWWQPDLDSLSDPPNRRRLTELLGDVLEDALRLDLVLWPGIDGSSPPDAPESPPDMLEGLPNSARQEAAACESALQRRLFAHAWKRGIRLQCQRPVLIYRLDFVVPRTSLGIEVVSWKSREGVEGWDRVRDLGAEGWRIISFTGEEIYLDADKCVDELSSEIMRYN
jgi:very-short-patch-repair endonuclease